MYTQLHRPFSRSLLSATATCILGTGAVAAKDHNVTIAIRVSSQGLDLTRPTDAHTLYTRVENAAWVVCTRGTRADLVPVQDPKSCYEIALAGAVRSAKAPLLTQIYLATHTPQQARAQGIEASELAAK
jgi:UrcA family protein